jgi:hypothetical protein
MLRTQEEYIRTNVVELREKIASGMEQIRRGELVDRRTAIQKSCISASAWPASDFTELKAASRCAFRLIYGAFCASFCGE